MKIPHSSILFSILNISSHTLMGQYYKSLFSCCYKLMISTNCLIIAEQVGVIFITSLVTIATM